MPESRNSQTLCKLENFNCGEAIADTTMYIIPVSFIFASLFYVQMHAICRHRKIIFSTVDMAVFLSLDYYNTTKSKEEKL